MQVGRDDLGARVARQLVAPAQEFESACRRRNGGSGNSERMVCQPSGDSGSTLTLRDGRQDLRLDTPLNDEVRFEPRARAGSHRPNLRPPSFQRPNRYRLLPDSWGVAATSSVWLLPGNQLKAAGVVAAIPSTRTSRPGGSSRRSSPSGAARTSALSHQFSGRESAVTAEVHSRRNRVHVRTGIVHHRCIVEMVPRALAGVQA